MSRRIKVENIDYDWTDSHCDRLAPLVNADPADKPWQVRYRSYGWTRGQLFETWGEAMAYADKIAQQEAR